MYVLYHVNYGYLSEFFLTPRGLEVGFQTDPELAIQFDEKAIWYSVLSFFASHFAYCDNEDHLFFEIQKLI